MYIIYLGAIHLVLMHGGDVNLNAFACMWVVY